MTAIDKIARRLAYHVNRIIFAPRIQVDPHPNRPLVRLGSKYGGWVFEDAPDLQGATIVSCGLGEDASFDIEFAAKYAAKVLIVDPTPRAISHFQEIQQALGQSKVCNYESDGKQPMGAYSLEKIGKDALILEPSAIWTEATSIKFFAPPNPAHVSHSIVNFQNDYSVQTSYIEVPAITPEYFFEKYGLRDIPLIKLDIEGAEIHVLRHMVSKSILPRQILVEFDELTIPSRKSRDKAEDADRFLRSAGYLCRHNNRSNFLYTLEVR